MLKILSKRIYHITILIFIISGVIQAQDYSATSPPNTFREKHNPFYWGNKKPYEGYWQQDVHYQMHVKVDIKEDNISGNQKLTYWNNSPFDIDYVFFHLYQNAFKDGSYYDKLKNSKQIRSKYGFVRSDSSGTDIHSIQVNGTDLKTELNNTVLKVYLHETLKSGDSIQFDIDFTTWFNKKGNRPRMHVNPRKGFKQYNCVHWYPRIAVYDKEFSWTTDQHLGREFYGDYGTFDVKLTLPSNYIVDGTGKILNYDKLMPDSLRKKLDITNFRYKEWNSKPSVVIPFDSTSTKTWHFYSENVHDFAFTADPTYRISESEWNGVKCVALVREQHAAGWKDAADFTAKIIKVYSEDFGMYDYHKIIVADADQGMEYPMLTLDGGFSPYYKYLFAHEIGHGWFFGMVGNNETYRAILDEGFTQFLTIWAMEKLQQKGEEYEYSFDNWYSKNFDYKPSLKYRYGFYPYLEDAISKKEEPLNTHSDQFNNYMTYRQVYYKGVVMLYNLKYLLGDTLFLSAMQNYVAEWKFCHPYDEDFRRSIIQYTQMDLNWFFDLWFETTKTIDYSVQSAVNIKGTNEWEILLKRKGLSSQMALDIQVIANNGEKHNYHIPNTWFEKPTKAKVLPQWIGWGDLNSEYIATVSIPSGIHDVIIDTSMLLPDIDRRNNRLKKKLKCKLDMRARNHPEWENYELFWRPDIWYNGYDGIKTGIHLNGNYMKYFGKFDITAWVNTGLMQMDYANDDENYRKLSFRLNYDTPLDRQHGTTRLKLSAKELDGLSYYSMEVVRNLNMPNEIVYLRINSMGRRSESDYNYLIYSDEWGPVDFSQDIDNTYNNYINLGYKSVARHAHGNTKFNCEFTSALLSSNYNYSYLKSSFVNTDNFGKTKLKMRMFVQYGFGAKWAKESSLYLSGGNPQEMMDNKFVRSTGFVPNSPLAFGSVPGNFHYGGGLNLRGYSGYWAPDADAFSLVVPTYRGTSGVAANFEFEFDRLLKFRPPILKKVLKINTYAFYDAGIINYNSPNEIPEFAKIRMDAGLGAAITVKKWWYFENIKPLTIRFDAPLFLNHPSADENYFDFRWVIAINRAF